MTQALSTTCDVEDDDNNSTSSIGFEYRLRGVLYNQYGYVDDRATLDSSDAADSMATTLAQYKLVSTAILIETLRELAFHPASADLLKVARPKETLPSVLVYDPEMRHIAVGTEAARGLPKMGIPAPIVENTYEGIHEVLTGSSTATASWEVTYALVSALQVLYFKALASSEKNSGKVGNPSFLYCWYYGTVSPGMTQESFHVKYVPSQARTLAFRLKMILCRYLLFPLLQRMEIAKTVDEAGRLLAVALVGSQQQQEFDYPNGCFVGAQAGTGGPLCEQSALEGGKQLSDPEIQRLAYQVVQDLIEKY
ncbi:hypothetical protein IV203_019792 [Nitzschia inconspicua]|uniref:Uncharacterized protein n=1 Tax=Nitzschia inconspicua TaxID=303405 RepID=A0A9K3LZS1_9STRA|nr:hypothetical protein IV203_019792 [Nitzschia inconspicua]